MNESLNGNYVANGQDDDSLALALESLTERLLGGEQFDRDDLVRDFGAYADRLADLLPTLCLAATCGDIPPHEQGISVGSRQLGDFRLLREAGRGAMGIVYEAEQLSLSRRVALKILPFAAVLDPRHLQRFKNEALAAAGLDHPHIVEVYGVGCERSVNFYAMRFVDGCTLADVIAGLRRQDTAITPPGVRERQADTDKAPQALLSTIGSQVGQERFQAVARLGREVAEALAHAHEMGVLHRDIKPSNLMLDRRGKVWVTDFGLAHIQANASLTQSGDLLGTLRYMSPEQAHVNDERVDERSDVYSLGATLYEALTLLPPFAAEERAVLLRAIAEDTPLAPRTLDRSIPLDLETIVLKCLAKVPADRYPTAQALADDLHRFEEQRSIIARRPSPVQVAIRWARRRRGLLLAGFGCGALVWLIATGLLWQANRETAAAYRGERTQRQASQRNLRLALNALNNVYFGLVADAMGYRPDLAPLQRDFVSSAIGFYTTIAIENRTNRETIEEAVEALGAIADLRQLLGDPEQTDEAYEESVAAARQSLAMRPAEPRRLLQLAGLLASQGKSLMVAGKQRQASEALAEAGAVFEAAPLDQIMNPEQRSPDLLVVADYPYVLGLLGRYRQAIEQSLRFQKTLQSCLAQDSEDFMASLLLARHFSLCGQWHAQLGELAEADAALEQSLLQYQAARPFAPPHIDIRPLMLVAQRERAAVLRQRGFTEAAKLAAEQADSLARLYQEDRHRGTISGEPAWLRTLGTLPR